MTTNRNSPLNPDNNEEDDETNENFNFRTAEVQTPSNSFQPEQRRNRERLPASKFSLKDHAAVSPVTLPPPKDLATTTATTTSEEDFYTAVSTSNLSLDSDDDASFKTTQSTLSGGVNMTTIQSPLGGASTSINSQPPNLNSSIARPAPKSKDDKNNNDN